MNNNLGVALATGTVQNYVWMGPTQTVAFDEAGIKAKLLNLDEACYVVQDAHGRIGFANGGEVSIAPNNTAGLQVLMAVPAMSIAQLGDPSFLSFHGVSMAYMTGAMANGIASEELVIALGKANILASFGAAGLVPARVKSAIERIQTALPNGPYAFNLIHSPSEEHLESSAVELFLQHDIRTVEASAYLRLTKHIVRYRAAGLSLNANGQIEIKNKVIAKISRREVATRFMEPAPRKLLDKLVNEGHITAQQADLATQVPMADDITVEADSGGHTDNRPLVCVLPSIIALRDDIQAKHGYQQQIRVGAAGGISTPESALGAFMMGASYIVTGSVNQACVEAGASEHTKKLLAKAGMADVIMAPAADMFEMGVKLQVAQTRDDVPYARPKTI